MSKTINLKNSITSPYFNKKFYSKDKKKLSKIVEDILFSLNNKKDTFHLLSKNFDLNFTYSELQKFNKFKSVIIIGMGGSCLGAEAIYSFCNNRIKKKFIFLNNLDQSKIKKNLNLRNCLFIVISKSGNTLETLVNSILFKDKINNKNTIIITEKKNNLLNIFAKKRKILVIEHKDYIGGRYSVLSEVGMVPAYFMGLKTRLFRKNLLDFFRNKKRTLLLDSVVKLSHIYKYKRIKSIVLLNYAPEVNDFLFWCQQLMAESLGKKGNGILPVVSPSPKDHHSLMQLYLDGPKKSFYTFFNVLDNRVVKINNNTFNSHKYLKNQSIEKIKQSQMLATEKVFMSKKIPFRSIRVLRRDEKSLGELFCFFILETILLGRALNVNPFDQPSVELIKKETKKILGYGISKNNF